MPDIGDWNFWKAGVTHKNLLRMPIDENFSGLQTYDAWRGYEFTCANSSMTFSHFHLDSESESKLCILSDLPIQIRNSLGQLPRCNPIRLSSFILQDLVRNTIHNFSVVDLKLVMSNLVDDWLLVPRISRRVIACTSICIIIGVTVEEINVGQDLLLYNWTPLRAS